MPELFRTVDSVNDRTLILTVTPTGKLCLTIDTAVSSGSIVLDVAAAEALAFAVDEELCAQAGDLVGE